MANFLLFSKWFYRGEGNKSLVISNPESRKVLRLQKSRVIPTDRANGYKETSRKESENFRAEIEKNIELCKQIYIPLFSEKYVEPGVLVDLPEELMARVKHLVTSKNTQRPKIRLCKEVHSESKFGVLMPDFCFVSGDGLYGKEDRSSRHVFSVEIKPKCGTMPVCVELGHSEYRTVKEMICKYCLVQWTKVNKHGKYFQQSGYCPLDLFSSNTSRVWHALMCLLQNPQNNLRIFQDGEMVYSEEATAPLNCDHKLGYNSTADIKSPSDNTKVKLPHLEDILRRSFVGNQLTSDHADGEIDGTNLTSTTMFLATLLQLLVHDSNESTVVDHNYWATKHPVCASSLYDESKHSTRILKYLLSKGLAFGDEGVLRKILDVQKLDKIGSDKAFSMFNDFCANGHKDAIDSHIFTLNKNISKYDACKIDGELLNGCVTDERLSIESDLDDITNFLIAASANDCSIMVSFQEVIGDTPKDSSHFQDVLTGKVYKYSIAVVDLDCKESDRIPKYYQEYHSNVKDYLCYKC